MKLFIETNGLALAACTAACGLNTFGFGDEPASPSTSEISTSTEPTSTSTLVLSTGDPLTSSVDSTTADILDSLGETTTTTSTTTSDPSTDPGTTHGTSEPTPAICGDGVLGSDEACDDGNLDDEDACKNDCQENPCGNGLDDDGEECDDGNREGGDKCSPTCEVVEILDVSVGADHTCALFASGKVRCWGQNESGALCNGKTEDLGDQPDELPVPDIILYEPVKEISSGTYHTCALLHNNNVVCWGRGANYQLGYGNSQLDANCDTLDEVPPTKIEYTASFTQIVAGGLHTCGIVTDKTVRCWGTGYAGQLGVESPGPYATPIAVKEVTDVVKLAAGAQHTCALRGDKSVLCWGHNLNGTLGIGSAVSLGSKPDQMPPAPVFGLNSLTKDIAAGGYHNCAIVENGDVLCWGMNDFGQLGTGTFGIATNIGNDLDEQLTPVDLGAPAVALALGYRHSCALLDDGSVKCWGRGDLGALGYGNKNHVRLTGELAALTGVELGGKAWKLSSSSGYDDKTGGSNCAILDDRSTRCWGNNDYGQLGLGHRLTIGDDEKPDDPDVAGIVPY